MNPTSTTDHCRYQACHAPIRWATSAASGVSMPLDADPVEPGTAGAFVLIGEVAFSLPSAVARLVEMFDVDDAAAHQLAHTDYGWHLIHFATCPFADQARKRGRRR